MTDIVERLRALAGEWASTPSGGGRTKDLCYEAADELARLRAIVDKLPKTKDNVRVVPILDIVWIPTYIGSAEATSGHDWEISDAGAWIVAWGGPGHGAERVSDCYSTRAATEAAAKEER